MRTSPPQPPEDGEHKPDREKIITHELRGYPIIITGCTCSNETHHWIKFGPGEEDEAYVMVTHTGPWR